MERGQSELALPARQSTTAPAVAWGRLTIRPAVNVSVVT